MKQCLATDFAENLLTRKKKSNKSLVQDITYKNNEL